MRGDDTLGGEGRSDYQYVGHLHLDDISAPVGKLPARRRPRPDLREIDDAKAFQGDGSG